MLIKIKDLLVFLLANLKIIQSRNDHTSMHTKDEKVTSVLYQIWLDSNNNNVYLSNLYHPKFPIMVTSIIKNDFKQSKEYKI